MKLVKTEEAVGHVLCHDMTQIIRGQFKGPRFRKGHVVTAEDIPVLLSMGKEHLYVWEMRSGMVHENDAAERLCALCRNANMDRSGVSEGKIELTAACDGLFRVNSEKLIAVNSVEDVMIATRKGNTAVRKGDKLAGTRVIPLIIPEEKLQAAEDAAGDAPLLEVLPYVKKTAAIIATGGGLFDVGEDFQQGSVSGSLFRRLEFFLLNDQWNDPGACQLIALSDGGIALTGGDHHILNGVDSNQLLAVDPEQAVAGGGQFDLALLDLAPVHVGLAAKGCHPLRRVVLMDHSGGHLPDVEMLLAHGQQDGDVLLRYHMALTETSVLVLVLDNLGHVVAQHMAHGIFGFHELHFAASRISISSPGWTVPSFTTTAKIPSVGMTHLPTAFLMAQSLWHSLPI